MESIKFLIVRGGMHGGMTFRQKVWAYKFSPTERNPRRYEKWFARPTQTEVEGELDKRCRQGWRNDGAV